MHTYNKNINKILFLLLIIYKDKNFYNYKIESEFLIFYFFFPFAGTFFGSGTSSFFTFGAFSSSDHS